MRTQQSFSRLSRLIAAMIALLLVFAQVASVAQAQKPLPGKERVQVAQVNLDEIQSYYGRLADLTGTVGVVVELQDTPAALVYAESAEAQRTALAGSQAKAIQQKQGDLMSAIQSKGVKVTELFRTQKVYNGIWMRVDVNDLKTLAALPGVKAIHPIVSKKLDNSTSVPLIGAPAVWGGSGLVQGQGMRIGIIDTGVDYEHADFGGNGATAFPSAKVVGGFDFVGDDYNADPASATYDPIPVPDNDPMDCNGHGSHVAGTAAGLGVKADGTTYVEAGADTYAALKNLSSSAYTTKFRIGPGVAPKASLYALRVFGCEGSTDVVDQAIEWAMDPNGDGFINDHLDVINMSLGSSFGSPYDSSYVAANNAAKAGMIVVASAGNSGDVTYITGSPASAPLAISVASSVDAGAVVSAFEVTSTTVPSALLPLGNYPASDSTTFGPQTYSVTGALKMSSAADLGCAAYPAGTFTGKIALINRGTCAFTVKAKNAQNAGAIGVLLANNVDTFPAGLGGTDATITIPTMMTTKTIGANIRTVMGLGVVTVNLTTAYRNTFVMQDSTIEDMVSSFSSRGPARGGMLLKPDITAPGDSTFSVATGTGNEGASFSGTSMAAPHVAGVMALLKQVHPTWSAAELKALAMNTAANDLWTGLNKTGTKYTPSRVGAGRVSVASALATSPQSLVVAYNKTEPGQVSVSFGEQAVTGIQGFTQVVTLKNTGATAVVYSIAFDSRYQTNPGLTFMVGDGAVSLTSVTVPANGTVDLVVDALVDASKLEKALDPTLAVGSRQRMSEGGGYVTLTSTSAPTLRVPVYIAARPASVMTTTEKSVFLTTAATGTFSLHPSGTPTMATGYASLVSIMGLTGTSPNEASSMGMQDAADIRYVGATSDYPVYPFTSLNPLDPTAAMYFGIATYGKWDTTNAVEFDVYIDKNEDGVYDYVVFNGNSGFGTTTYTDTMYTWFCKLSTGSCDAWYYVNQVSGATNTSLFNNNVMTLGVPLQGIGLLNGFNTDFNFYVESYSGDAVGMVDMTGVMHYDVANQAVTAVDTKTSGTGMPVWADDAAKSPTFDITYNKAGFIAGQSLLLLHHDNVAGSTAQVVPLFTKMSTTVKSAGTRDGWVLESGENTNKGGTVNKTLAYLLVGDDKGNKQYKSVLHFNTTLPAGAIVTKATLKIKSAGVVGPIKNAAMFSKFGGLWVDTRKPSFGTALLVATDFQAAGTKNVAKFGATPAAGWYSAPIKAAFINKLGTTQFRLHFLLDDNNNATANALKFSSGNAPLSRRPQLIVEYYIP